MSRGGRAAGGRVGGLGSRARGSGSAVRGGAARGGSARRSRDAPSPICGGGGGRGAASEQSCSGCRGHRSAEPRTPPGPGPRVSPPRRGAALGGGRHGGALDSLRPAARTSRPREGGTGGTRVLRVGRGGCRVHLAAAGSGEQGARPGLSWPTPLPPPTGVGPGPAEGPRVPPPRGGVEGVQPLLHPRRGRLGFRVQNAEKGEEKEVGAFPQSLRSGLNIPRRGRIGSQRRAVGGPQVRRPRVERAVMSLLSQGRSAFPPPPVRDPPRSRAHASRRRAPPRRFPWFRRI